MLSDIRDRASKLGTGVIAVIIIIPMAFWGIQEYFSGAADSPVAEVAGQTISQAGFRNAVENQRQYITRLMGDNVDNSYFDSPEFRRGVLDGLIQQTLVLETAREQGYRIGDAQLNTLIRGSEMFQKDGEFDAEAYQKFAISQGDFSRNRFEERLRDESLSAQLTAGYAESAFVLPGELTRLVELAAERRGFSVATVSPEAFGDSTEVSDQQIEDYYRANEQDYMQPAQTQVQYLELSVSNLIDEVEVTDEQIDEAYRVRSEELAQKERRATRHILIEADDEASEEEQQQALAEATDLASRARAGEDFAALATEFSDDIGSARNGGDLGVIERGQMVQPFEDAAFSLPVGEISDPVKSQFGYHVILVEEIVATEIPALKDIRDELVTQERRRLAENRLYELADQMKNLVYEQPDTLEGAADELELEIQTSEWFSADSGDGIAANPQVRRVAFSEEVLEQGYNSDAIELNEDTYVALRKLDYKPAAPRPLDEVRESIARQIEQEQAGNRAAEQAGELLAELQTGADWADALQEAGLEGRYYTVSRADGSLPVSREVLDKVFSMAPPESGEPRFATVEEIGGATTVIRFDKVEALKEVKPDDQLTETNRSALRRRHGQDYANSQVRGLRDSSDLVINQELL